MSNKRINLSAKLMVCNYIVKDLLSKIDLLEINDQISAENKLNQLKKIKEQITKVGMEIDKIKKEIIMISSYNIN